MARISEASTSYDEAMKHRKHNLALREDAPYVSYAHDGAPYKTQPVLTLVCADCNVKLTWFYGRAPQEPAQ